MAFVVQNKRKNQAKAVLSSKGKHPMNKIALVDDDRNILTSVSMTLEAEGFEVSTFNDGQSALDSFNKNMPDMAVLDIKMPRMDGMDLLQRLRQKDDDAGYLSSRPKMTRSTKFSVCGWVRMTM